MTADNAASVKCENCGDLDSLVACPCHWPGCELRVCHRCDRSIKRNLSLAAQGRIVLAKPPERT
jgi:hypothetical protein